MDAKPVAGLDGQKIVFPVTFVLRLIMICGDEEDRDINHISAILESQEIKFGESVKEKAEGGKYYKLKIPCTIADEVSFRNMYSALSKFGKVKAAI